VSAAVYAPIGFDGEALRPTRYVVRFPEVQGVDEYRDAVTGLVVPPLTTILLGSWALGTRKAII
jgi:hypothetical protein